jgi:hypothetical protein
MIERAKKHGVIESSGDDSTPGTDLRFTKVWVEKRNCSEKWYPIPPVRNWKA